MAFIPFTFDVQIHTKLGNDPNVDDGYAADEIKALFDSPMVAFKDYINNTMIPALDSFTPESSVGVSVSVSRPLFSPVIWWKPNASGGYDVTYIDKDGTETFLPPAPASVADGSIQGRHIATGTITGDKIAERTIPQSKIIGSGDLTAQQKLSIFPVGYIWISLSNIDPGTFMGGTWRRIEGRFLFGADSTHALASTGGSEKHTITTAEMPAHTHNTMIAQDAPLLGSQTGYTNGFYFTQGGTSIGTAGNTSSAGSGRAMSIMPPYMAVYMWERIA